VGSLGVIADAVEAETPARQVSNEHNFASKSGMPNTTNRLDSDALVGALILRSRGQEVA